VMEASYLIKILIGFNLVCLRKAKAKSEISGKLFPCVLSCAHAWSGTKHLKTLDMSRAPGLGPGYPCLGHWVLGLGPSI
jgi:hypothetical protein